MPAPEANPVLVESIVLGVHNPWYVDGCRRQAEDQPAGGEQCQVDRGVKVPEGSHRSTGH